MKASPQYVVTFAPRFERQALAELRAAAPDLTKERELAPGVALVRATAPEPDLGESLVRADPVFVRHVAPVQWVVHLTGRREADLAALRECALPSEGVRPGDRFCVQCRRVGRGGEYGAKDVEVAVGSALEARGAVPVFSDTAVVGDPDLRVLALNLYGDWAGVGWTTVLRALNEHCDEHRVFSRWPRPVSRAEHKLREALRKFGLAPCGGVALDLGAAPGGWSRVLAEAGMRVVAVDPADLHPRVRALAGVTHVRARVEAARLAGPFDLVTVDVNVAPEAAAPLLTQVAPHLRPGAPAVWTLKLVRADPWPALRDARALVQPAYEAVRCKHLYHNRRELTLLLRRREGGPGR